uniref:Uncharacterized protein n=1 Tax=Accipiter nisus TaxID=211598 RepID=A0A8B9MVR2_9AVES
MYTNVFLWSFQSISQPASALVDSPLPVHISRLQPQSGFAAKSFTFSLLQLLWQTANCSHAAGTNAQMSRAACSGAGLCSACPGLQAGCPDCTGAVPRFLAPVPVHTNIPRVASSRVLAYQMSLTQQHREFYRDKSGMLYVLPCFVLPSKEKERYPHPPPLSAKTHWHLLRVSPVNLRTYQTFPSGKRVTSQERETRDSFFEYRA